MASPEWVTEELARRAEEARLAEADRQARRAAYDEWAARYAAAGAVFSEPEAAS
jgi:hypothetical protein